MSSWSIYSTRWRGRMNSFLVACRARACSQLSLGLAITGLLVSLLAPAAAWAQTATSNLRGYARGENGTALAGAEVSVRNLETNQRRTTTSSPSGYYHIGGLRPGQYDVTVRRIGLAPQTRTIRLLIGQTQDANFALSE